MNPEKSILDRLTDEQKKRFESAQSPEELHSLAKETGFELSQEQLDAIAGSKESVCWRHECSAYIIE